MTKKPNDMPPIKETEQTQINQNKSGSTWILVLILSIVSIILLPIFSRLWILVIIPIAMAIISITFALKDFENDKRWIIALVLSIIACVNVVLAIENGIIDLITRNSYSYNYTYHNEYDIQPYFEDDWYDYDYYWD